MGRFVRSGTNWEGRPWSTAHSLNALMDEIEAAYPAKRPLDGTVASKTHDQNNPSSDHRPAPYSGFGWVRAVDIGEVEPEGEVIAEAIRASRDPRVRYVIHEGQIFSSYATSARKAWAWGPYSGYNAHLTHVHVSVLSTNQGDNSPWNLGLGAQPDQGEEMLPIRYGHGYKTPPADSGLTGDQTNRKDDVIYIQNLLARAGWTGTIDGVYGSDTVDGVKQYGVSTSGDGKTVTGWVLDNLQASAFGAIFAAKNHGTHGGSGEHNHDGRYLKSVEGKT